MTGKFQLLLCLIIVTLQLCSCENKTYDLEIPDEENKGAEHQVKIESQLTDKSSDDKNVNKRRSFYNEKNDRKSDYDFMQKTRYEYSRESDFDDQKHKNFMGNDKKQDEFGWEGRNQMPFMGGVNGPMDEDRRSSQSYMSNSKMTGKMEWENPRDYYNSGRNFRVQENRDSRYRNGYSDMNMNMNPNMNMNANPNMNMNTNPNMNMNTNPNMNMNTNPNMNMNTNPNMNMNDNRRSFSQFSHKEQDVQNDFSSDKGMVTRIHPRFNMPPSLDYSLNNDFMLDDSELCKPEKAIIINLKTECPLSKSSRNRVVHKYLFPPKAQMNPPMQQLLSSNQYYSSNPDSFFYSL